MKKEKQFSKQMCNRSWQLLVGTVVFSIVAEFILAYTGRGSITAIVSIVTALITFNSMFIQGGYITQNIFRDKSLNDNGIHLSDGDKHYIEKDHNAI